MTGPESFISKPLEAVTQRFHSFVNHRRQQEERRQAELDNAQRIVREGPTLEDIKIYDQGYRDYLHRSHFGFPTHYDSIENAGAYGNAIKEFEALPIEAHREKTIQHAQQIIDAAEKTRLRRTTA